MRRLWALCILTSLAMGAAAAQADMCDDILALGGQGGQPSLELPDVGPAERCGRSAMLTGETQIHCRWAFAYRSPAAAKFFEQLINAASDCLGPDAHATDDLDVNHPDFYDLQTFQLADRKIGISLKDKAALSQTYVFVRVTRALSP